MPRRASPYRVVPPAATVAAALLALAVLAAAGPARAEPRYTARYGQNCVLCHVNPTGGGMRSAYASQFLVPEELAASGWQPEDLDGLSPQLTPNVAMGLDLRTLVWEGEAGTGSVLSMQGDLYLDARLGRRFFAYLETGQAGAGEVFGAIHALPLDGWLKAGRFVPDYGWRFADHQLFARRYLLEPAGADRPARLLGSGLEAGISPGPLVVSVALLGETREQGDAWAARALYHRPLGPLNAGVGASVLRRDGPDRPGRTVGGFWYASAGPVTWLGQVDRTDQDGRRGDVVSHELTVRLRQGVDLRGTYGFQDPDRDVRSGARERWAGGVAWLPYPFFGLQAMVGRWQTAAGTLVADADRTEGTLVVHFFY